MDLSGWSVCPLDAAAPTRPLLADGELYVLEFDNIGLYRGELMIPQWQTCRVVLTNHRVMMVDSVAGSAISLPLPAIGNTSEKIGFGSWSHRKIRLHMASGSVVYYMLSFRAEGIDEFHPRLLQARKEFLKNYTTPNGTTQRGRTSGGIQAVTQLLSNQHEAAMGVVQSAFQDLESLEVQLKSVLEVARQLQGPAATRGTSTKEEEAIRSVLQSIGIEGDVVTMAGSGSVQKYIEDLSVEALKWLDKMMTARPQGNNNTNNGIMTLHDVYALYNRSRGHRDLVSPSDLLAALQYGCTAATPTHLVCMRGTYWVVHASLQVRYEDLLGQLRKSLDEAGNTERQGDPLLMKLNDVTLSRRLGVSVTIARELLFDSEERGVLCRSESPEGLDFYDNFFVRLHST